MWQSVRKRLYLEKPSNAHTRPSQSKAPCTTVEAYTASDPVHDQIQSPLFKSLSTELRLAIYEAALADPDRLLHIVPVHGGGIGNWRCRDTESPFPTWQHSCYGRWFCESERRVVRRLETRSNSNLLPLLLTCRRIYSEAIDVLYTSNDFSFKGAGGVLRFESLLPSSHWHRLRRVHISTVFITPMRLDSSKQVIPPESYVRWEKSCKALSELENLHLLFIDFTIWSFGDYPDYNSHKTVENDALIFIFKCLQPIRAVKIEVELNMELPELVKNALTPINILIKLSERSYDLRTFNRY